MHAEHVFAALHADISVCALRIIKQPFHIACELRLLHHITQLRTAKVVSHTAVIHKLRERTRRKSKPRLLSSVRVKRVSMCLGPCEVASRFRGPKPPSNDNAL